MEPSSSFLGFACRKNKTELKKAGRPDGQDGDDQLPIEPHFFLLEGFKNWKMKRDSNSLEVQFMSVSNSHNRSI